MCLIVYLSELLKIKVRIDLRRRDTRMTEQLLHGTKITARLEHMRSEGMSEHVRVNVNA